MKRIITLFSFCAFLAVSAQNNIGMQQTVEIPIGIISTKCAYLNYDEEDNNNGNLTLQNGVFVPINYFSRKIYW
ncbi:hypothetical protein [Chryseobacterium koreense]|uniref:hypothetical protein n=1 Tax=Chryseobacterium koreense TaxID=232216 RepID=UPI0026EC2378|nr:hypothetical protein [Chryseobacterium koreense]